MRTLSLLLLFELVSFSSCLAPADSQVGIAPGDFAPAIESIDIDGRQFTLGDLRGNYVLIDFWGSWCGPCLKEAPELVALHEKYKDKGLKIVSIAIEKNDKNWKKASEKLGYTWKHQLVEVSRFVRFNKIASDYEVSEIPALFLIDPDGKIIGSKLNASNASNILAELL